ncbi:NADH-quinone oxidoreductase subunit NuoF [Paenibacillus sp. FSL R5-0912]|uniref:NADH-quinone oxidoreductase subunit NuoF n=1 Tax=Paenibacillus sp. FSL R5-0912 TaxID=1536771 RepID=UPI000B217BA8|nr:NADH-quinone oxidoreductase subunit NuoF [Paenibacillus sp. FSL R5-0912]
MKLLTDLEAIRTLTQARLDNRRITGESPDSISFRSVMVCGGTGCTSSDSNQIIAKLNQEIAGHGIQRQVEVVRTGCFGLCELGPVVIVYPEGIFYSRVEVQDIPKLVETHLLQGKPYEKKIYEKTKQDGEILNFEETEFYKKQVRIALHNCGVIDPENIDEYIGSDGYQALDKVLKTMSRQEVIDTMKQSGLRGRGGGGFNTGLKWEFAAKQDKEQKYVICNADEGDPGAFMDRSILEGNPHSVIEAMAIAGYAIGSNQGFIYVRAEYPIAVQRFMKALEQAREYELLGDNILGTGFSFNIDVRLGAGAFVCGEETALIHSIEGHRGMPTPKPPFPAVQGLWGQPTIINNVETLANVAQIILKGAPWYASIGTEKSKGTKVFALGGKVVNTGLVEVPMGITLREVIFEIGGGIPGGKKFKAVQTGGPSGGCLTEEHLDCTIDFDTLTSLGSMMGSGGMIIMDEDTCMVDVARFYLDFTRDESCGKCTPCRIGTKRLLELLDKITEGKGSLDDLEKLENLSVQIKNASLCALGQTAPNPVLSTIKYFREEYLAHIEGHKCPAGVCKSLISYEIDPDLCRGCSLCAKKCPTDAISGELKEPFVIDTAVCIKCGVCFDVCKFEAVAIV